MEERRLNIRRIIFFWLGAVVALLLFEILWHYYHTGRVIITTDNKYNTITLSRIDASGHSIGKSTKAYSKLSKTLDTGQYTVSVNGNSVATVQTFTLKPRQTLRFTINPINTAGVEPVVYERADALAASAQQLVYFNSTSGGVFQIDAQNNLTRIAGGRPFQAVKWANPSFGVAQNNQDNHYGGLFVLNNGAVSTLKMPFFHSPSQTINFDVASDKAIDVSYGSAVYAGGQDGKFKKVYTAPSSNPTLAAGANGEVAISAPRFGPHPSGASKPVLATVDSSGDTYKKNVEAERMAWSPNGRYLATLNDSSPTIYDDELDIFAVVPTSSTVGQFTWLNNDTLLYTMNDQLWTYSLSARKAQLLANTPQTNTIQGLYVSSDGAYIYMPTYNSIADSYAVVRMGLHGQKVPDYIYNLQDILPLDETTYFIKLINFAAPTSILVQPYSFSPPADYVQQAQSVLQSQGFDTNQFNFQTIPLDANSSP